jgi:hypothetical protein
VPKSRATVFLPSAEAFDPRPDPVCPYQASTGYIARESGFIRRRPGDFGAPQPVDWRGAARPSSWISWDIPEDHSLVNYLGDDEEVAEFGYKFSPCRGGAMKPAPLLNGIIDGAGSVWDAVADEL